ncbi:hypothetical protein Aca07nite_66950 [Actinoplanes capillaceus]|uniref:Uncharacterized protein n=1 Tax=Actinoplanes campanulatus TaxID=113559 RepID=A0ABQ3WT11_9ACTN|nr:hypothetical protein GCM10010109_33000 [Actinoplanes campanulatus]GID41638.1 hypothetical protein Aca09nite_81440 [Actinoplanes campanulatus]GID49420.1 hypothetical protein Aca07nite_66950 [Actinoplanes capillaceus]
MDTEADGAGALEVTVIAEPSRAVAPGDADGGAGGGVPPPACAAGVSADDAEPQPAAPVRASSVSS